MKLKSYFVIKSLTTKVIIFSISLKASILTRYIGLAPSYGISSWKLKAHIDFDFFTKKRLSYIPPNKTLS